MEEKMGEKIEKIEKIDKLDSKISIDPIGSMEETDAVAKSKFDSAMAKAEFGWEQNQAARAAKVEAPSNDAVTRPSLIEEISFSEKKIQRLQPATIEQITAQAEDLRSKIQPAIEQIDNAVKTNPDARIGPVAEAQLSQRLVHIDSSLRSVTTKLGVIEVGAKPGQEIVSSENPLVKFDSYLTTSDHKLQTILGEVRALDITNNRLTPEKLLAVQIKLGFVQQELEFFSNVLNKSLEAIKTTMNVQI